MQLTVMRLFVINIAPIDHKPRSSQSARDAQTNHDANRDANRVARRHGIVFVRDARVALVQTIGSMRCWDHDAGDQRHDPDNHDEVHRFGKLMQAKRRSQSHTCPLICDNGLRFEVWPLTDTCATPWKAGPCTHVSGHCFSVWTCVCGRVRLNKGLVGCGMAGSCTADSLLHVFVVI